MRKTKDPMMQEESSAPTKEQSDKPMDKENMAQVDNQEELKGREEVIQYLLRKESTKKGNQLHLYEEEEKQELAKSKGHEKPRKKSQWNSKRARERQMKQQKMKQKKNRKQKRRKKRRNKANSKAKS